MSLYESLTIIFFDEALKYVSTRCAITNFCLDSIWNCKYDNCSNQCDGHQDKYRNRIHCMEDHYSDINGLQYASKPQKSKFSFHLPHLGPKFRYAVGGKVGLAEEKWPWTFLVLIRRLQRKYGRNNTYNIQIKLIRKYENFSLT